MTSVWKDRRPERPDRYLDWEVVNWPWVSGRGERLPLGERWCSVLVQVRPGSGERPTANLEWLLEEAAHRSDGPKAIAMHSDERHHLKRTIDGIKDDARNGRTLPEHDDVRLQFFVYMREASAYAEGNYATSERYEIRLVGPPIETLRFHIPPSDAETRFPPLPPAAAPPVAIGVIDDGIAFANERFRTLAEPGVDGGRKTRIWSLWLQSVESATKENNVAFGARVGFDEIDNWLAKSAAATGEVDDAGVYRLCGMHDFRTESHKATALRAAHGTHVMDLACGYDPKDPEERMKGLLVPILAVQLPDAVTADTSGVSMGSYVLQALRQIILWADRLDNDKPVPLVVNFSYGILAGPKDGTHYLEREIDRLVAHRNKMKPTIVVLPAGNAYRDRTTARTTLDAHSGDELDWVLLPDDGTPSYLEIWCDAVQGSVSPIDVSLTPPLAGLPARDGPPEKGHGCILEEDGKPVCGIYYDGPQIGRSPRTGDCVQRARIFIAVNPTRPADGEHPVAPAGVWKLSLTNMSDSRVAVDLFIQRDDTPAGFRRKGRQSYFDHPRAYERDCATGNYDMPQQDKCPITSRGTLSAIGNGMGTTDQGTAGRVVLVGAALDGEEAEPADYTSSGPTSTRAGPDFSAIAEDGRAFPGVLAAGTASGSVVALRGTSAAAPRIARKLAELGANVEALKRHCGAQEQADPRLGHCVVETDAKRTHIPERKRRNRGQ